MPGCRAPLAELVIYLAKAPKSTRAYEGYNRAERLVKRDPTLLVPIAMRDIPVGSMEEIGYGEAYKYHPEYMCVASHLPHLEQSEVVFMISGIQ
jgi:putative ATPase